MDDGLMKLTLLLPFRVFLEKKKVKRIVVDSNTGSIGLLPHRLDCVVILVPGILCYETVEDGEVYVAVDEGILVKTGTEVCISVRNAIAEAELGQLRSTAEKEIRGLNEDEKNTRSVLAKLETEFIRQFEKIHQR